MRLQIIWPVAALTPFFALFLYRAARRAAWELWVKRQTGRWP